MLFVCYPKCTTCQKARAWLDSRGVTYDFRDIKQEIPTRQERVYLWQSTSKSWKDDNNPYK